MRPYAVLAALLVSGSLSSAETPTLPAIAYRLPIDAKVSMLLTAPDGTVVRELLHAAPRRAGAATETWDGLDEQGRPVPAGTYTWKALATQGLTAEYLTTIGTNPTPGWEAWPGNHGPVSAVAVDETGMYAATGCGEGTCLALKQTLDGQRLWTIPHWLEAWCGPTSMASDGGTLYMMQLSGKVFRTPIGKAAPQGDAWNLEYQDDRAVSVFKGVANIMDLDAGAGQVVLSYARHDLLRWVDPATGKEIDTAAVPQPYGVAVDRTDGSVLVISEEQVLRLSRASKKPQVVIPKGQLVAPYRLSVDPSSGDILVAENWRVRNWVRYQHFSKDHEPPDSQRAQFIYHAHGLGYFTDPVPAGGQQVKRFTRTGTLVAAYGAVAGRTPGPHQPEDFDELIDIAATADGGFIIAEEGLTKRTARFDRKGACVHEWFGGWGYGQAAVIDPADPTIAWITDRGHFIKTRLDVAKRTWQYLAAYPCHELMQWFNQEGPVWRIAHRGGQTYFALIGWYGTRSPCLIRLDEASQRLVMCDAGGGDLGQDRELHIAACAKPLLPELLKSTRKGSWTWADLNGDGLPTRDELAISEFTSHVGGWYMDDDFTWWFHAQDDRLTNVAIFRLPPRSWAGNTPVYHFDDAKAWAKDPGYSDSVWRDSAGNMYTSFNHAGRNERTYGIGGWSGRAAMNRVAKLDPAGKVQWVVGRHAAGSGVEPGEGHYLVRIVGTAKGCVVANDMENGWAHVWDQDGLWVGRFFENPVIGPDSPLSAYEQCGENFGGSIFTDPKSGEVFYIGGGINNCPVYRISGWDRFQRQSGSVVVTPAVAATLTAKVQAEGARSDVAHIPFMEENRLKLDGNLAEWKDVKPLLIVDGGKTLAKVYLAWNTYFIYAAFDVDTKAPWANASKTELAFQGGAAVDLSVGPLLPARTKAMIGDYRVVAAPIGGAPTAVEYYPLLPREFSPPHSRTNTAFKTLVGETVFERVKKMETYGIDAGAALKGDASGYIVEFRLFRHAPLEFAPGLRFRLDASVILADPSGTKSILRLPWHSRDSADMMTQDTYTEAVLRPQDWGEAVLE
jgi:hypothetical protein